MQQGPTILVTRPEPDARDTATRLEALGLRPILAPLLEMHLLPATAPSIKDLAAVAITSSNAIRALERIGFHTSLFHLPVFTVGDRTADFARSVGFENVTSATGNFDDLVVLLAEQKFDGKIYYPTATHISGDLMGALAPFGQRILVAPIYQMLPVTALPEEAVDIIKSGNLSAISLYSRRTAETFCTLINDILPDKSRSEISALCLSQNVAAPMIAHHFTRIALADYPSEEAMMALALSFTRNQIR